MGSGKGKSKRVNATATKKNSKKVIETNKMQKDNPGVNDLQVADAFPWLDDISMSEFYLGKKERKYTDEQLSYMCTELAHDILDKNNVYNADDNTQNVLDGIDRSKLSVEILERKPSNWDGMDYVIARLNYDGETISELEYEDKYLDGETDGIFRFNLKPNVPADTFPHAALLVKDLLDYAFNNDKTNYLVSW